MKKIELSLIIGVLMMLSITMAYARTYEIKRKCYLKKLVLTNLKNNTENFGIKGNVSGGRVKIKMWNAAVFKDEEAYNSLIYGATSSEDSPNNFVANPYFLYYPTSKWSIYFNNNIALKNNLYYYQDESTEFKNRLFKIFAEQSIIENWIIEPQYIDVIIELEIFDGVTLSDIKEISLPGIEKLTNASFTLKEEFNLQHYCADAKNANGEYCTKIKNIRKIDLTKNVDVIIQAHRGLWGGENPENSLGALRKATTDGEFLLEYDIMPYGVSNYTDTLMDDFANPSGLVCFHDMELIRLTNYHPQNSAKKYIFNSSKTELENLQLIKPRSTTVSNQKLLFYEDLIRYAATNNLLICIDMKNLEGNDKNSDQRVLPLFDSKENQLKSQMLNVKMCIELAAAINVNGQNGLKNIAIKTYYSYDELKDKLVYNHQLPLEFFNQVLWAPRVSENSRNWGYDTLIDLDGNGKTDYDPNKILTYLNQWFSHNESVLYYETNFKNDSDNETAVLAKTNFPFCDENKYENFTAAEYIYKMSGRRAGIFSEEPIGSKGVPGRWNDWSLKDSEYDRRADHIWLIGHPFMQYSVITTDRSDIWNQFNK